MGVLTASPTTGNRRAALALGLIALATLLSMSVWFSASFVVPQLQQLWNLTSGQSSLLTIAVQLGFVVGALTLAATGLADAVPGRRLMCAGALGAAAVNLGLLWAPGFAVALLLRMLTGAFLVAVYPPALKEVSSWFQRGRGTALGVMIGALTLGSAAPQLVKAAGGLDWQLVIVATSALTAAGGA
ncbi:MFS transporter, partial [Saccharopolyspora sp. NPDC002686]|uniref:MFS transporter n=1 Tax=Saccharopolyspora sp. NPDC002686 TaxID=3154541 RepID=UPI0033283B24